MSRTLWDLKRGERCLIADFDTALPGKYRTRLIELGFHRGSAVSCVVAPRLGAPKLYRVSSVVYSMERQIAQLVNIEELGQ